MQKFALIGSGVLLAIAMCASQVVVARGTIWSTVVAVRVDSGGRGMVVFNDNIGGDPANCRDPELINALAFNTTTSEGKAVLAPALTAKLTGAAVATTGTGTCVAYGNDYVKDWDFGSLL